MNDIMIARIVERLQDNVSTHMHFYMRYRSQGVDAISYSHFAYLLLLGANSPTCTHANVTQTRWSSWNKLYKFIKWRNKSKFIKQQYEQKFL